MDNAQFKKTFSKPVFLSNFQHKNPVLATFLTRMMVLYALWEVCFHIIWAFPNLMAGYRAFSLFIIKGILQHTAWVLELLGYSTEMELGERIIKIVGTTGVSVGEPCIGFGVMAIFFALIISYPGLLRKKIWFLPLGLSLIYTMNIIRIAVLAIMVKIDPTIWELNHKFIFKIIIYSVILLLWRQWMKWTK
ncbi:archaeosortase/exosortase family protein [Aureispira anguillae]|uniref:Archaeosortase/exosortase family protein n=1 Tax=Aureispira anguillae TaxID=2864201 RepID=A0A915VK17_9BACT|nr:archaeosortase/exosortase family protein [Aureispira anguillae]BDS09471.1 archaeosortase/exosortase family protein [Aureispira anguillae]